VTFFNKKEDVMKIELTPHGRKLLSQGKLKPAYYSFFDDDILYDSQRGGFSEANSQTKTRILSETPYLKPQTNYKGVESRYEDQRTEETENYLLQPIGANKIEEEKTNGWQVTFLHNSASTTTNHLAAATSPTLQIPQIETTIEYTMSVDNGDSQLTTDRTRSQYSQAGLLITEQQVLLDILERNGFSHGEALDLEVFLYEQDETSYKKLNFVKPEPEVINDNYISKQIDVLDETFIADDRPDLVEFWIRFSFDGDVSKADVCRGITNLGSRDIYLDTEVDCSDVDKLDSAIIPDIYATSVSEIEDCEE